MLNPLPDHVELALELGVALDGCARSRRTGGPPDENLLEDGLDGHGARAELAIVGRDVTPAEHELAFVDHDLLEERLDPLAYRRVARQKHEPGPIAALAAAG